MRARDPDSSGRVERDGIGIHWECFGDGEPTILLLPTWSIMPSRHWKLQIPYLARRHQVITFDGRGSGRSDRPKGPEHYTRDEYVADALAVLDDTAVERALLVTLSRRLAGRCSWPPTTVIASSESSASHRRRR